MEKYIEVKVLKTTPKCVIATVENTKEKKYYVTKRYNLVCMDATDKY